MPPATHNARRCPRCGARREDGRAPERYVRHHPANDAFLRCRLLEVSRYASLQEEYAMVPPRSGIQPRAEVAGSKCRLPPARAVRRSSPRQISRKDSERRQQIEQPRLKRRHSVLRPRRSRMSRQPACRWEAIYDAFRFCRRRSCCRCREKATEARKQPQAE